jgi:hypothetical protein
MSDWQPIETCPKDGSRFLIAGECKVTIGWWHENKGRTLIADDKPYWEDYDHSGVYQISDDDWIIETHWMPLPQPPGNVSSDQGVQSDGMATD